MDSCKRVRDFISFPRTYHRHGSLGKVALSRVSIATNGILPHYRTGSSTIFERIAMVFWIPSTIWIGSGVKSFKINTRIMVISASTYFDLAIVPFLCMDDGT